MVGVATGIVNPEHLLTVVSSRTGAMTDCAKWLNGLGVGARYDGTYNYEGQGSSYIGSCEGLSTGTVDQLSYDQRVNVGKFIEAQMDSFESAAGWIFWTWKTESAPEWDFQALSDAGIIATPVTDRYCELCWNFQDWLMWADSLFQILASAVEGKHATSCNGLVKEERTLFRSFSYPAARRSPGRGGGPCEEARSSK